MNFHFNPPFPGCALAVRRQSQLDSSALLPEEASLLSGKAVQKRRTEFALGRAAAREALAGLGFPEPLPVLRGAGREPRWPEGVVGSITHCGELAIAVAAKQEGVKSIGIDLEDVERITEEIVDVVANAAERRWVFGGEDSKTRLAMLFSAKESVYKTIYPLEHRFFDFHAVELSWLPGPARFAGRIEGYSLEVGCQLESNFVFTHAFL